VKPSTRWSRIAYLSLTLLIVSSSRAQEKSVRPGINDPFKNPDLKKYLGVFEGESREIYAKRNEIVAACRLKPGMVVADVGAGTGLFTRLFAKDVGPTGKVYAVDIAQKFLDHIARTAKEAGLKNIVPVLCTPTSAELPANSVDLVFICDTYHHFEFPFKTMASVHRALRPGGRVVLIDFHRIKGVSTDWVMSHVRAGQETFAQEIRQSGFKQVAEEKLLKENYLLRFEKTPSPDRPLPRLDVNAARPPVARRIDKSFTIHGETRNDPYFWMREKTDPAVIDSLEAENTYARAVLKPTEPLQEELYSEMVGRLVETDLSVPYRQGGFWYYSRTVKGMQYPIYCRKKGTLEAAEQVVLDLNELGKGKKFVSLSQFGVSDDGNLLAYSIDFSGFREYTLFIRDLRTDRLLPDRIPKMTKVRWAGDNKTLYYVVEDAAKRPYRLYRHTLGQDKDPLIYEEKDELYRLSVTRSRDRAYLFATSASATTTELRALPSDRPQGDWKVILPRVDGEENFADHRDGLFYILTNKGAPNFRLVTATLAEPLRWKELVAHRPRVMLEGVELFKDHCVLTERDEGQERIQVIDLRNERRHEIEFREKVYSVSPSINLEFDTHDFRLQMQSLTTPPTVYDYDMEKRALKLLKRTKVLGGYDPENYVSERVLATASDGTRIPISLVYSKGMQRDGKSPMLLYAYGAYGVPMGVPFSSPRVSLLDRGVIYAIAHVRGGGEMGKAWHNQGKMLHKRNTFTDFIAAADFLVKQKYTSRDRLAIEGRSAGGLTMAAVLNLRPDLCKAAVLHVPFVDAINTMLDPSLPLTIQEYLEWGNPNVKQEYDYIKSYCPYSNVGAKAYPAMLVRTAFNDSQVMYWEPAKYVAKLRATKTDYNPLLFTCNMSAGHGGHSGRYDALRETALTYAFILCEIRR
jgi:oligopeptidase B